MLIVKALAVDTTAERRATTENNFIAALYEGGFGEWEGRGNETLRRDRRLRSIYFDDLRSGKNRDPWHPIVKVPLVRLMDVHDDATWREEQSIAHRTSSIAVETARGFIPLRSGGFGVPAEAVRERAPAGFSNSAAG